MEDNKPVYLELETINKIFKSYKHRQDGPYGKRNLDRKRTNHGETTILFYSILSHNLGRSSGHHR